MLILSAMIGFAVLVMGRQLFWVSVAGLGFVLGMDYAMQYFQGSIQMILLISLGTGLVGAVLAYTLQRAAAGLVGFLAGWYLSNALINFVQFELGQFTLILAVISGLIGVVLTLVLFDWSLILLSCLAGATIITQSLQFPTQTNLSIFIILFLLGITIQGLLLANEKNDFK